MRTAVHHLRRPAVIKRAPAGHPAFPSPAVFDGIATSLTTSSNPHEIFYPNVAWSMAMPGPIVDDTATRFRYCPLDAEGFAFCRSAISAVRFSFSA
jgi:hypothetical protein